MDMDKFLLAFFILVGNNATWKASKYVSWSQQYRVLAVFITAACQS